MAIEITERQDICKKFAWIPIRLEDKWTWFRRYYHVKRKIVEKEHIKGYHLVTERFTIIANLDDAGYLRESLAGNILLNGAERKTTKPSPEE